MINLDLFLRRGDMHAKARHHEANGPRQAFSVVDLKIDSEHGHVGLCLFLGDRPALADALVTAINQAFAEHGTTEPDAMRRLDTIAAPILGQVLGPGAAPIPQAAE